MKTLSTISSIFLVLVSFGLIGCASDGPELPPRLNLSPKTLLGNSEHGEGTVIKLSVINQISHNSTSAYGVENNLRELFTDLLTDSLEQQGFEVTTNAYEDTDTTPVYYNIIIQKLNNKIEQTGFSSEITVEVALDLRAKNNSQELTKTYSSKRLKEVALTPTIDEVTELTNLAVAQIVRRLVRDEELRQFTIITTAK